MKDTYSKKYRHYMKDFDERYREIVCDGNSIDLYTDKEHHLTYHVKLTFLENPTILLVSGDCGTWVFGHIERPKSFFCGTFANIPYWSEKVISESKFGGPVVNKEIKSEDLLREIKKYLKDNYVSKQVKESILDNLSGNYELCFPNEAFRVIDEVFKDAGIKIDGEEISSMIQNCETYSQVFINICMLLQWIENKISGVF